MLVLASALLWLAALFGCDPPTLDAVPSRCVNSTGVTWLPAWEVELLESLQAPDADRAIYGASNPDLVPTEVDYLRGKMTAFPTHLARPTLTVRSGWHLLQLTQALAAACAPA
jgi:hypothetical protein